MQNDIATSGNPNREDAALKREDLALKDKEIKWSTYKAIGVALATTTVVGAFTAFVNWQIQQREIRIKELEQEQRYITQFREFALNENLQSRIDFALYVSHVATNDSLRALWRDYHTVLENTASETRADLKQARDQLQSLYQESQEAQSRKDAEITALERQIDMLESQLTPRSSSIFAGAPLTQEIMTDTYSLKFTSTVSRMASGAWRYTYSVENLSATDALVFSIKRLVIPPLSSPLPPGLSTSSSVLAVAPPEVVPLTILVGAGEKFLVAAYVPPEKPV